MRILFLVLFFCNSLGLLAQSVKSPEEFLGYPLGERFTNHHQIVDYFRYIAEKNTEKVRLQTYGYTNEHRPLLLACISAPENMARLEAIRENNLAMAGLSKTGQKPEAGPVIVWLSYNVHGNESSSSEVSMKVLYELLQPSNAAIRQWLKNTVVIIDPCLNPDGRERYVNWYNQIVGVHPNSEPTAAEHNEPWPEGRGNHYYYDLNRDWAWQTQVESQQRVAAYQKWMPQIHVDFHEQYPGSPYYFAPAAEPFHEVITPWQRQCQTLIGKNHARYFDANGWLYFTREYFDLFYPAYGDTYPIYNGSIGMTYEQAGHGVAGLSIRTGDDTLTLAKRIEHHFVTSLSTIEVASNQAEKINSEFQKYFSESVNNGIGTFKSYVIQNTSAGKLSSLFEFFKRNQIQFASAVPNTKVKGYDYISGKESAFTLQSGDIIVSAYQPASALIQVLFEPRSFLADSSTYDITAWSIPYAFGMQAYAVKEKLPSRPYMAVSSSSTRLPDAYGYLVKYNSLADGKLLASLLNSGVKVRYAEKDFVYQGRPFPKGTLVILKSGNEAKIEWLKSELQANVADVTSVTSGFMDSGFDFGSDKLHLVSKPRVAVVTGSEVTSTAVGEVWHFMEQELKYPVTMLSVNDVHAIDWKKFDVCVLPSGNYKFLSDKDQQAVLKEFVNQGGRIIAMENAVSPLLSGDWGCKLKKEEEKSSDKSGYEDIKKYGSRDRDGIVNNIPGAIYKVELDNTHPLAFGYTDTYFSLKRSSDLLEFLKTGWNVGVIKKENQVSGFVGSSVKDKLRDGTVISVQPMGKGSLICFTDDPLFRSFWENGKLLFVNALFLTAP